MNTCNCRECNAQRYYSFRQRRKYFDPRYYNFSGDTVFNEVFNELLSELEFNLKRYRKKAALTDDKSSLRKQARDMSRHEKSGILQNAITKNSQVDHIIPLKFSHLFTVDPNDKKNYKMDNFIHPNSPKNLRVVTEALHKKITEMWKDFTIKEYNPAVKKRATKQGLKKMVEDYAKKVVNPFVANYSKKPAIHFNKSNFNLTNDELQFYKSIYN